MSNKSSWNKEYFFRIPQSFDVDIIPKIKSLISTPESMWEWSKKGKLNYPDIEFYPTNLFLNPVVIWIDNNLNLSSIWLMYGTPSNPDYWYIPINEQWLLDFIKQSKNFHAMNFSQVFKVLYGWDNKKGLRLCDVFLDLLESDRSTPAVFPQKDIDCSMGEEESMRKAWRALDLIDSFQEMTDGTPAQKMPTWSIKQIDDGRKIEIQVIQ